MGTLYPVNRSSKIQSNRFLWVWIFSWCKSRLTHVFFSLSLTSTASSSSPLNTPASTPHYLLSSICNLVPVRLYSTDYVQWKCQISAILKAHALYGQLMSPLPYLLNSSPQLQVLSLHLTKPIFPPPPREPNLEYLRSPWIIVILRKMSFFQDLL